MELRYIILLLIISFVIGYFWGRYIGKKDGIKEAKAVAPLILRRKSLEQGICLLCNDELEYKSIKKEKNI
ncbi:hypothetical protein [Orenia marismortui]|uniref:Uncharacterized protein n=1 Tax=Orenia marismortui TaxID=46469 RepID=A0A4R8H197_9FIRM|nr:hypothetical protein [Orenia marismortui]TDX53287.1 hypothetical protein C7959_103140 [Orenia marismortui]